MTILLFFVEYFNSLQAILTIFVYSSISYSENKYIFYELIFLKLKFPNSLDIFMMSFYNY